MSEQTTLRDQLSTALEAADTPETVTEQPEVTEKPERARDESGRFKAKDSAQPEGLLPTDEKPPTDSRPSPADAEPIKPPSSWKKDYWEAYGKLEPSLRDYINQREQQFASGVSTYKQEAERARELNEAIAPFLPDLQQHNMQPSQWISSLGRAHQVLAKGSPAEKIQVFGKLAQDYGVSVPHLLQFLSGNANALQGLPQAQPQQVDMRQSVKQILEEERLQSEVQAMASNPEFPHFSEVRATMAGLLQAGIAQDLKSAYEAALALPSHRELLEADRQQREAAEAQRVAEEKKATANRARANNLSPKSATPAAPTVSGKKGLRDILTDTVEQVMGGGRV